MIGEFTMDLPICTIISKNYLAYARTLVQSYRQHNGGRAFVLLVDRIDGYFDPKNEAFTLIPIEELFNEIPNFLQFCFQYSITELNTAVKPYFLSYLFQKHGLKKIVYLDPDCWVLNSLSALSSLLDHSKIVLTPHITEPIEDSFEPDEVQFLRVGAYNLGFIGLSLSDETFRFLEWWKKRLYKRCVVAPEYGLFVDQKWIDLVPGLFSGVYVLREPGYNIAYWNFHCRDLSLSNGQYIVNDQLVYFIHLSGFDPNNIERISRYQNRWTISKLQKIKELFFYYREAMLIHGYDQTKAWPYAFGYFDNGRKIPDYARKIFIQLKENNKKFSDPFCATGQETFYRYLQRRFFLLDRLLSLGLHYKFKMKNYPWVYKVARSLFVAVSQMRMGVGKER